MKHLGSLTDYSAPGESIVTKDYLNSKLSNHKITIELLGDAYWINLDGELINTEAKFKNFLKYAKEGSVRCEFPDEETSAHLIISSNAVNSSTDEDYSVTNNVIFQFPEFDIMFTYDESTTPYCKLTKLSHGGGSEIEPAAVDKLGGMKLFNGPPTGYFYANYKGGSGYGNAHVFTEVPAAGVDSKSQFYWNASDLTPEKVKCYGAYDSIPEQAFEIIPDSDGPDSTVCIKIKGYVEWILKDENGYGTYNNVGLVTCIYSGVKASDVLWNVFTCIAPDALIDYTCPDGTTKKASFYYSNHDNPFFGQDSPNCKRVSIHDDFYGDGLIFYYDDESSTATSNVIRTDTLSKNVLLDKQGRIQLDSKNRAFIDVNNLPVNVPIASENIGGFITPVLVTKTINGYKTNIESWQNASFIIDKPWLDGTYGEVMKWAYDNKPKILYSTPGSTYYKAFVFEYTEGDTKYWAIDLGDGNYNLFITPAVLGSHDVEVLPKGGVNVDIEGRAYVDLPEASDTPSSELEPATTEKLGGIKLKEEEETTVKGWQYWFGVMSDYVYTATKCDYHEVSSGVNMAFWNEKPKVVACKGNEGTESEYDIDYRFWEKVCSDHVTRWTVEDTKNTNHPKYNENPVQKEFTTKVMPKGAVQLDAENRAFVAIPESEIKEATETELGGIKLFGDTEELPEKGIAVQLQDGKAYVKSTTPEANIFAFAYDSSDPSKTTWTTENKSHSTNIFTTLYDKDRNVALADINVQSDNITISFEEPLQDGDSFTLLYSSSAGGATPTPEELQPDDITIAYNEDKKLQVKDGGLTFDKFASRATSEQNYVLAINGSGRIEPRQQTVLVTGIAFNEESGCRVPNLSIEQVKQACEDYVNKGIAHTFSFYVLTSSETIYAKVISASIVTGGMPAYTISVFSNGEMVFDGEDDTPPAVIKYTAFPGYNITHVVYPLFKK